MNFQDIIKPLSLTPAVETHDSPFDKGYTRAAGTVGRLGTYLLVPFNLSQDAQYKHRLMFQYNYSFDTDLYLTNIKQLMNFSGLFLLGGCLTVKWRAGTKLVDGIEVPSVLRYKLLDSSMDTTWSGFSTYTNQRIKKNFCLEFWTDNTQITFGLTQDMYLKTDRLTIPDSIDEGDAVFMLDSALPLASLVQPFPLVYPIDYSNQAFLDNL